MSHFGCDKATIGCMTLGQDQPLHQHISDTNGAADFVVASNLSTVIDSGSSANSDYVEPGPKAHGHESKSESHMGI